LNFEETWSSGKPKQGCERRGWGEIKGPQTSPLQAFRMIWGNHVAKREEKKRGGHRILPEYRHRRRGAVEKEKKKDTVVRPGVLP